MRIALTIHALQGGGAERVLARLAEYWSAAGHELHLITWSAAESDELPLPPAVRRHGLDLLGTSENLWQGAWANYRRVRALRQTLRRLQPDLVLSFCDQMNICTLQATRGLKWPVWIAEHSDPSRQRLSRVWEWMRRRNYPRCTGCVVLTPEIAEHLAGLVPRSRLAIIPNAVDPPQDSAANPSQRSIVLSIGRLSQEKGVDLLLQAWQQAHPQLEAWELCIVGDGPQRAVLERQAAALPRVHFAGWLSDPSPAYRTASLFVLPSRYEGFPMALLEAMSHGLACVATQSSQAVTELSRGGEALQVVPIESPPGLASALIDLAADSERRQKLGTAAQAVSLQYNWSHIGPLWDRLLS